VVRQAVAWLRRVPPGRGLNIAAKIFRRRRAASGPPAPSTPVIVRTTGTPTGDETLNIPAPAAANAGTLTRSIRIFPYPELPAYNGYGNVDDGSSFVGRVSTALQQPTPWLGSFNIEQTWCTTDGGSCWTTSAHQPPWWSRDTARAKNSCGPWAADGWASPGFGRAGPFIGPSGGDRPRPPAPEPRELQAPQGNFRH
jgi:hypothetical protein